MTDDLRGKALAAVSGRSVRRQLFRQEVVDFQQSSRQLGRVVPLQKPATRIMFLGISGAVIAVVGFLFVGQYARKESAAGYLVPAAGTARVFASQPGTIGNVFVQQGDSITKGQALLSVITDQISTGGDDINTELTTALRKQKDDLNNQITELGIKIASEHDRLTAQIIEHQTVLSGLQTQLLFQRKRIENLEKAVEAGEELRPKGLISEVEVRTRENALLEQKQALMTMTQQIIARQGQLSEVEFNLKQLPYVQNEKLQTLKTELSGVDQHITETKARKGYVLRAPISGYVSLLEASTGNPVDPKKLQLQIVPRDSPLQATLFVPARAIGFVKIGQDVRIMFDAFPYQHFGTYHGHVSTVSKTMLLASDVDSPVPLREPAYTATVTLDQNTIEANGMKVSLQPDMVLRADIILERRTLAAWILAPWRHILPSFGNI